MLNYKCGVGLVLLAGALWSTLGLVIRFIEGANVWQILCYRSIALSLFLFVIILCDSKSRIPNVFRNAGFSGVIGGLSLVMAFAGGIYSIQNTSVANAMLLFATAPFLAAILGRLILRESVRISTWIAMCLAILGVLIMVWGAAGTGRILGNIAGGVSALGFAIFTVMLRFKKQENMMPAVFLGGIFSTIISSIICVLFDYTLNISINDMLLAMGLGVFQVGAGLSLYAIGAKFVPASELALLSMTEVILGPIWVWAILDETVESYTLLGGIILLFGIGSNAISGMRRKPVPIL